MLFICLLSTYGAMGQQGAKSGAKTTENKFDPKIDYKQPGSPMPRLKVLLYHDTAKSAAADSPAPKAKKIAKKNRKNMEKKQASGGDTAYLTNRDLDNGANLFVVLFNPTCGHCQDMTKNLEANMHLFKKTNIVMVATPVMRDYLHDFTSLMKINQYPAIQVGTDSSGFVDNVFLYQMLPQLNIYDGDRKLLKIFTGDVPMDSVKKYIQ